VNEEILNSGTQLAQHSDELKISSRISDRFSGILDSVSYFFFYSSFSGLTHLLGSLWNRLVS